jgi:hypothetical protein
LYICGIVVQEWCGSCWRPGGKHSQAASDLALSNTITPGSIVAADFRKTTRDVVRHKPVIPQLDRSLPLGEGSTQPGWLASTAISRTEMLQGVATVTQRSLAATRKRTLQLTAKSYVPPEKQSVLVVERIRERKACEDAKLQALQARYGVEGAQVVMVRGRGMLRVS